MERMQTTTTSPQAAEAAERKVSMTSTFESQVREFAAEFNTPSVRQMVTLCEAGRITWADAYEVSRKALAAGIASVA
jgi:hypothetical protein